MKLIYIRKGETIEVNGQRLTANKTGVIPMDDDVRQFDEKGNEIVMYINIKQL